MFKRLKSKIKDKHIEDTLLLFIFIIIPNTFLDIYFIFNHSVSDLTLFTNHNMSWLFFGFITGLDFLLFVIFEKEAYFAKVDIEAKAKIESERTLLTYLIYSLILIGITIYLNIKIYGGSDITWPLVLTIGLIMSVVVSLYGEQVILKEKYDNDDYKQTRYRDGIFTDDLFTETIFVSFFVLVVYFIVASVIFGIVHILI